MNELVNVWAVPSSFHLDRIGQVTYLQLFHKDIAKVVRQIGHGRCGAIASLLELVASEMSHIDPLEEYADSCLGGL